MLTLEMRNVKHRMAVCCPRPHGYSRSHGAETLPDPLTSELKTNLKAQTERKPGGGMPISDPVGHQCADC